jgi:hypothetical protein
MCALGLLFGVLTRLSSLGIALMSITFFIVKGVVLWQGGDLACGCFGAIVTTFASLTIYMDPPILLMSLAVMSSPRSNRSAALLPATFVGRELINDCDHGGIFSTAGVYDALERKAGRESGLKALPGNRRLKGPLPNLRTGPFQKMKTSKNEEVEDS